MNHLNRFWSIFIRYLLLLAIAVAGLDLFYFIFTPLTVYPVFFFLGLFFSTYLSGTTIYANSIPIEIIGACVAGSAYYLLLLFNFSTPGIKIIERVWMIASAFLFFLLANVLRIILLSWMYLEDSPLFDIAHKFLWYFGSTILVIGIWFYQVKSHRIGEIPFYSDLKFLYENSIKKLMSNKKR